MSVRFPVSGMALIRLMRPNQWTKNAVVLAALIFAFGDRFRSHPIGWVDVWKSLAAVACFCLASSGIYALNDIVDAPHDRLHPQKKFRPVAAGAISPCWAWFFSLLLMGFSLAGAIVLFPPFARILFAYLAIQALYTFVLKRLALVDVFIIAIGFVLRAIAGAIVLQVSISPWLLLCAFLLALFLALCKRRHEKILFGGGEEHRASLEHYNRHLLDQLIAIVSAATIVCYAIYTLWPDTVHKFGTTRLALTIPFVMFGVFRYLDLVYRQDKGGRPEKILLTDIPLIIDLMLYGFLILGIFLLGR